MYLSARRPTTTIALRDERGAVLILALAVLVVVGTLVAGLLTLAGPSFVTTNVVRNVQNAIVAADAGVEYGIQVLRSEEIPPGSTTVPANSIPCSFANTSAEIGNVPSVNGEIGDWGTGTQPASTVRVSCSESATGGSAAGGIGWAVVTNDPSSSSISDQAGGTKSITGPVYDAGGWSLQKLLTVKDGDVYTANNPSPGSSCSGDVAQLAVTPTPPYTQQCVNPSNFGIPAVPDSLPSAGPPSEVTPSQVTTSGSCTTFVPGTYDGTFTVSGKSANTVMNNDLQKNAYFESGTYYLNNLGNLTIGTSLFGGQPSPGESQATTTATACASDPNGWSATNGEGVEFILGGNTTISVGNNSTMELYTRTQCPSCNDGSSPYFSLFQIPPQVCPPTPPNPTCLWNPTTLTNTTNFLDIGNGANVAAVVHGAVFGPSGSVSLFATNNSQAVTFGGLDVWDITFKSSASATGLITSVATTPGHRVTTVTATATLASGRVITASAVVQIANDSARTVSIESWNVQQ